MLTRGTKKGVEDTWWFWVSDGSTAIVFMSERRGRQSRRGLLSAHLADDHGYGCDFLPGHCHVNNSKLGGTALEDVIGLYGDIDTFTQPEPFWQRLEELHDQYLKGTLEDGQGRHTIH